MSKTLLRHTLIKKYFWHFSWLPYLHTFSLYGNASFIIVSAETEYISTRSWYRNINFLRDWIRRIFSILLYWQPEPLNCNESGRFGALKSDSTHHFFGNACTKSGSLRFSQFSGCWLHQTSRSHYSSKVPAVNITVFKYRNKIGKTVVKAVPYSVK
jgi:hypothetical protein